MYSSFFILIKTASSLCFPNKTPQLWCGHPRVTHALPKVNVFSSKADITVPITTTDNNTNQCNKEGGKKLQTEQGKEEGKIGTPT